MFLRAMMHVGLLCLPMVEARMMPSLDKAIIRRVLRSHANEVRGCYQEGLRRDPRLAGRVLLWFRVGDNGDILAVRVTGPQEPVWQARPGPGNVQRAPAGAVVLSCIADAVSCWRFPGYNHPGSVIEISYPLVLVPPEEKVARRQRPGEISDEELAKLGVVKDADPLEGLPP